jgi:hypothetical protein
MTNKIPFWASFSTFRSPRALFPTTSEELLPTVLDTVISINLATTYHTGTSLHPPNYTILEKTSPYSPPTRAEPSIITVLVHN